MAALDNSSVEELRKYAKNRPSVVHKNNVNPYNHFMNVFSFVHDHLKWQDADYRAQEAWNKGKSDPAVLNARLTQGVESMKKLRSKTTSILSFMMIKSDSSTPNASQSVHCEDVEPCMVEVESQRTTVPEAATV